MKNEKPGILKPEGGKIWDFPEIWDEKSWEKQREDWVESMGNESTSSSDSLRSLSL